MRDTMRDIGIEMIERDMAEMIGRDTRRRDMAEMKGIDIEMIGIEMIEETGEIETRNGTGMIEDERDPEAEADPKPVTEVGTIMTEARTETSAAGTRMTRLI